MDIKENTKGTPEVYKPKIRIQLLSGQGSVISDRLVDQNLEFNTGPKISHDGGIRLDLVLTCKSDIDRSIEYIKKLSGTLPIKEVNSIGRPSSPAAVINSPREEILQDIEKKVSEGMNQDEIINYLRKLGFVFLLTEDFLGYFKDFPFRHRDIGEPTSTKQYPDSYQWMVRCIKRGKDPKTDKYDPQIIFGFKIMSERVDKVIPYLYKDRKKFLLIPVPSKLALSFNNTEMTKFPKYMMEDERFKFSTEMRQLLASKDKKPSKFFLRWYGDVIFPTSIGAKLKEKLS